MLDHERIEISNEYKFLIKKYLKKLRDEGLMTVLVPGGYTAEDYLYKLCFDGLKKRYSDVTSVISARLNHEVNVINALGLSERFLIIYDLVNYARDNNILVGPGRGAIPGCLFSYCLGITEVDPIEYSLWFERFINYRVEPRLESMSVVIDIEIGGRQTVLDYALRKYGNEIPKILDYLEIYVSESRELSVIKDSMELVSSHYATEINLSKIDLKDDSVYEFIRTGDTMDVLCLEEDKVRGFIAEQTPRCMEDLMIALSLSRPGLFSEAEEYLNKRNDLFGVVYEIPELKPILRSTSGCVVFQEQIMDILHVLGGFSLEESDISRRSMCKKELVPIVKDRGRFVRGNEWIPGCVSKGISEETADRLFTKMSDAAAYTFNKSHAAAYVLMVFRMAWLKKYYGSEFIEAINMNKDKEYIEWVK